MMLVQNTVLDIPILILLSIGILTSLSMLILIFHHRQQCPSTSAMLLICNSYVGVILYCIFQIDLYWHVLYGHLNINVSFNKIVDKQINVISLFYDELLFYLAYYSQSVFPLQDYIY